jgi:hypothetical protein
MKLSRFTKIGMAAVGLLFLVWLVILLATRETPSKTGPAGADERHCPVCGRELPRAYWGTGECPYCQMEAAEQGRPARAVARGVVWSPVIPSLLVVVFVALLTINLVVGARSRVVKSTVEVLYHLNCPKCGRKLRYRAAQVGRLGKCPLCRRPIIFPQPAEGPSPGGWAKVRRWLKLA